MKHGRVNEMEQAVANVGYWIGYSLAILISVFLVVMLIYFVWKHT